MPQRHNLYTFTHPLWRAISVIALGLGIYLVLELVFSLKYRHYQIQWEWLRYGTTIVLAFLILAGIPFINRFLNRQFPWEQSARRRFVVQWMGQTAWVFLIVSVIRNGVFRSILHPSPSFINMEDETIITFVLCAVMLLIVSSDLAIFLLNKWRVSLAQLERFKKENSEFHLEMLKTQVNPHFLFNNLNALSSLIYTNPDTAAEFVRQLANVYRYVLENRTKEIVSLREELTFLQAYIYLMDLRFGHNLRIHADLPASVQRYAIAPLTLQMLIENAIKHNIVSQKKPLDVFIFQSQEYLVVQNPLQLKAVKEFSSQIGLKNISSRYRFITDKAVEVINDTHTFTVKIPLVESTYGLAEKSHASIPESLKPA